MGVILTLKTFQINTYPLKSSKAFRVLNKNPSAYGTGIEFDVGHTGLIIFIHLSYKKLDVLSLM